MLSIVLGFLGYSVMNISQALQKIGIQIRPHALRKGALIWVAGTFGTFLASIILFSAVALGRAALVGTTAGTGLASLAVFSHFVMKEKIGPLELAGIAIIAVSAGFVGVFSETVPPSVVQLDILFVLLGIVTVMYTLLWLLFLKKKNILGIVIGSFSGALGGFVLLFQKVASSEYGQGMSLVPVDSATDTRFLSMVLAMFSNPFALIWIVLSLVSILILQFSYKKADAIRIIPFFSSSMIVIPVIGGVLSLSETLHPLQWGAVFFILCGLFLLTVRRKKGVNNPVN